MNYLEPIVNAHPDWFEKTAIIYDAEALFAPRDVQLRELRGEILTGDDVDRIYRDEVTLATVGGLYVIAYVSGDGSSGLSVRTEWNTSTFLDTLSTSSRRQVHLPNDRDFCSSAQFTKNRARMAIP